jgi:xanthine dehydrogenase iron-sulfur cluster and FAD-binding subunit A
MIFALRLKDTLCRCAGYPSIENAIIAAAEALRTGEPVQKPNTFPIRFTTTKLSGIAHLRPEAIEKVTGEAIYTDDLKFDGMLYAKAKRAMIPHGFLTKLDISKAKALKGVVAVLTADRYSRRKAIMDSCHLRLARDGRQLGNESAMWGMHLPSLQQNLRRLPSRRPR